jgi:hypothetical protein
MKVLAKKLYGRSKRKQKYIFHLRRCIIIDRKKQHDGRETLETGVSSTFGCIPIDVVFARIMPSSGWKFSRSARVIASPPIMSASTFARSRRQTNKIKN